MTDPDITQWAWDEAGRVFSALFSIPSEVYQEESWSLDQEHIARALLEAERRAEERNAETIRRLQDNMSKMAMDWTRAMASERQTGIAEGMERAAEIAEEFRDGNPKPTIYVAIADAIRAAAKEIEP